MIRHNQTEIKNKNIEKTKKVYLDGNEYIRVFFEGSEYFEDIPACHFIEWVELMKHNFI